MPTDDTASRTHPGFGSGAGRSMTSSDPSLFHTAARTARPPLPEPFRHEQIVTIYSAGTSDSGVLMPTYILLSKLTDEGRKTLKQRPERLSEVNKEIEAMGGRVSAQYAILGGYDFVNVVEAPSNEVIARISVELGSRGTVEISTFPAMSIDTFRQTIRRAPS